MNSIVKTISKIAEDSQKAELVLVEPVVMVCAASG